MGSKLLETKVIKDASFFDDLTSTVKGNENKGLGRISNGLSANMAQRKQHDLFKDLDEAQQKALSECDEAHYVDRKGKSISLSVDDVLLVKALSARIPFNDPSIRECMKDLNNAERKYKMPVIIPVSVLQLSKDIIGDTKEASLKKIGERLKRLAEINQVQYFSMNGDKYSLVRPLIHLDAQLYKHYSEIRSSKGRKKAQDPEVKEEKILVGASIFYSPLFLYEAANKYCPLYPQKMFEVCRRNKTELFSVILSDLESKFRQYYLSSLTAEREAKEENKGLKAINREEYNRLVDEAVKKALTYKSRTMTIRDRVTTDYETNRKQRSRFIPDLQRAITSLVEYGIITNRSVISKDKNFVFFCYNPDFTKNEDDNLLTFEEVKEE